MRLSLSEVLFETSKIKDRQKRIEFLRENHSPQLIQIVKYALDPKIKWLLPPGIPPYKKSQYPDSHGILYARTRELYLFVEGGNPNLSQTKRETLFINLLESLEPKDAELLLAVKDKRLPYRWITRDLLEEAFPGSFPETRKEK